MIQVSEAEPPTIALYPPLLPDSVEPLRRFFASQDLDAYLVGGAVRDSLLGRELLDLDIAVRGDAERVAGRAAAALGWKAHPLDSARGIFRLSPGDDAPYVDLSPVRGSIESDLAQRDFTIDAIALPLTGDAAPVDPHDGAPDLDRRVIRALSSDVFVDDPGRLLRAVRLAAQLGFDIEPSTTGWIRSNAGLISSVAPERTREELLRLFGSRDTVRWLREMDELGLLCRIVPELEEARGVAQPKEHYWDVFDHCIETVGQVERLLQSEECSGFLGDDIPVDARDYFSQHASDGHMRLNLLKLVGLLHDISKPATKTIEPSGRIRFFGHDAEGAEVAGNILRRLRFSGAGIDLVSTMVEHHLRPGQMAKQGELPTRRAVYRFHRDLGQAAIDTVYLNLADYLAARGPDLDEDDWDYRRDVARLILRGSAASEGSTRTATLIDGHDIMREMGIPPGPKVGEMLEMVREAHSSGCVSTKEEALALLAGELRAGGTGA